MPIQKPMKSRRKKMSVHERFLRGPLKLGSYWLFSFCTRNNSHANCIHGSSNAHTSGATADPPQQPMFVNLQQKCTMTCCLSAPWWACGHVQDLLTNAPLSRKAQQRADWSCVLVASRTRAACGDESVGACARLCRCAPCACACMHACMRPTTIDGMTS
jgi:hypothetical protein